MPSTVASLRPDCTDPAPAAALGGADMQVVPMLNHDITLVGSAAELEALRAELTAAGARHISCADQVHLEWRTPHPAPIEALSAAHPEVDVSLRRFAHGSDCVDELTIRAGRVICDRKRRTFRAEDGEVDMRWGRCMDEDGERLDPALLRRAGEEVLAIEHDTGPGRLSSAFYDALLLSQEAGRFADAVDDPLADGAPDDRALDALRHVASVALTVGCTVLGTHTDAELLTSRVWRMHEVVVHAGSEDLWSTPGKASWTEWAGYVLSSIAHAVDACLDSAHHPVWENPDGSDVDHLLHPDRHVEAALGGLVSTWIQALVLFGPPHGEGPPGTGLTDV